MKHEGLFDTAALVPDQWTGLDLRQSPPEPPIADAPAKDTDWDIVDENSWESFPASDAPGWI